MHRAVTREAELGDDFDAAGLELQESVERVLRHPAVASKSFLITIGDRTITGLATFATNTCRRARSASAPSSSSLAARPC